MFIKDFTADISTLNFGTEKDTKTVHDRLHANGIITINELCHLTKKHIEALGLEPTFIELHLKKNGLSFGMSDALIIQHQRILSALPKMENDKPSSDEPDDKPSIEEHRDNSSTDEPNAIPSTEETTNEPSTEVPEADAQFDPFTASLFALEANWSERYFELVKSLFISDRCIFRSTEKKMKRAIRLAYKFILLYYVVNKGMIEKSSEQQINDK